MTTSTMYSRIRQYMKNGGLLKPYSFPLVKKIVRNVSQILKASCGEDQRETSQIFVVVLRSFLHQSACQLVTETNIHPRYRNGVV